MNNVKIVRSSRDQDLDEFQLNFSQIGWCYFRPTFVVGLNINLQIMVTLCRHEAGVHIEDVNAGSFEDFFQGGKNLRCFFDNISVVDKKNLGCND